MPSEAVVTFWVEAVVAALIALAFFVVSFFQFKPHQMAPSTLDVRIGALLQGLAMGLMLAFVITPLRMTMATGGPVGDPSRALASGLGAVGLLYLIRRGTLMHVPGIGRYFRAYRRASLRRTVDDAQKALGKLDPPAPEAGG